MKRVTFIGIILAELSLILISFGCEGQNKEYNELPQSKMRYRSIDSLFKSAFPANLPGCVVLVMKNGKVEYRQGFGLANMEQNVPIKPEMLFKIGSTSKQFTAVAVMKLVEKGKINLDTPMTKYLDNCPEVWNKVLIRHLLNHTSGIVNINATPGYYGNLKYHMRPGELLDLVKNEPLEFNPGGKWKYNNSGYVILAMIIEKVTGVPFHGYMKKEIFIPCGMIHTTYQNDNENITNLALGYQKNKDKFELAEYMSMSQTFGGGDVITNVDDMAKWINSLANGVLINMKTLNECFTNSLLNDKTKSGYGFGWFIKEIEGMKIVDHGGGIYGFVSHTIYIPDQRLYVCILRNSIDEHTAHPTDFLAETIVEKVLSITGSTENIAIQYPESPLSKYVGSYIVGSSSLRKIELVNGRLYYKTPPFNSNDPWDSIEIKPKGENIFFAEGKRSTIEFIADSNGIITGYVVKRPLGFKINAVKIDDDQFTKIPDKDINKYVGTYQAIDDPEEKRDIVFRDGEFFYIVDDKTKITLKPKSNTKFNLFPSATNIIFEFDKDLVTGLTIERGSGTKSQLRKIK